MATALTPAPTLYQGISEILDLLEAQEQAQDPAQYEELADAIRLRIGSTKQKVDACGHVLSELCGIASACELEAKRLATRSARATAAAERLKAYILESMQAHGVKKLEGTTDGFRCQANPPSVDVEDVAELPEEFIRITQRAEPDRQLIARCLKAGQEVPGARLKQTLRLVRT